MSDRLDNLERAVRGKAIALRWPGAATARILRAVGLDFASIYGQGVICTHGEPGEEPVRLLGWDQALFSSNVALVSAAVSVDGEATELLVGQCESCGTIWFLADGPFSDPLAGLAGLLDDE
jgi:hypothetical protein